MFSDRTHGKATMMRRLWKRCPPSRMLAWSAGLVICVGYIVIGTVIVLLLAIGGLWEGFARREFTLLFIATVIYVYGTAYLAFRFALEPRKPLGFLLLILVLPMLIYLASPDSNSRELRHAAENYALATDPEVVETARQRLVAHGRRAGHKDYIAVLLQHLDAAQSDRQRVRLVCMLGVLSYQHDAVQARLRELRAATRDDPNRGALRDAVERALLRINPYQRDLTREELEDLAPSPRACSHESLPGGSDAGGYPVER